MFQIVAFLHKLHVFLLSLIQGSPTFLALQTGGGGGGWFRTSRGRMSTPVVQIELRLLLVQPGSQRATAWELGISSICRLPVSSSNSPLAG